MIACTGPKEKGGGREGEDMRVGKKQIGKNQIGGNGKGKGT